MEFSPLLTTSKILNVTSMQTTTAITLTDSYSAEKKKCFLKKLHKIIKYGLLTTSLKYKSYAKKILLGKKTNKKYMNQV